MFVIVTASCWLVKKLRHMITHGTYDAVLAKLAVLSINSFCSDSETIFADLFQVCHVAVVVAGVLNLT